MTGFEPATLGTTNLGLNVTHPKTVAIIEVSIPNRRKSYAVYCTSFFKLISSFHLEDEQCRYHPYCRPLSQ